MQKRDFETPHLSYLFGEWRDGGWWSYELAAFLVKEPVGLFALLCLAAWAAAAGRGRPRFGPAFWLPPLAVTAAVSTQTNMSHHPRYLLPAYGFAFVLAGGAVRFGRTPARRAAVAAAFIAAVAEPLAVMPWPHAFVNAAAGGPRNGWRLLDNSGMDWGQGDAAAAEWARANGLELDGTARFRPHNSPLLGLPDRRTPSRPRPGAWAVGSSPLSTAEYAAWRELEPAAVVGGNVRVFMVE